MTGPLSRDKIKRRSLPPGSNQPTAKKREFRPQKLLRVLEFTDDRFYPTMIFQWRPLAVGCDPQIPVLSNAASLLGLPVVFGGLALHQLWRHESVTTYRGEAMNPVDPTKERWVPVGVEGVS